MDEKQTEIMEAYLQGKLSATEKEAFESQLEQDQDLRAALQNHQRMMNAIRETEFRKVLKEIQQQKEEKQGPKIRRTNPMLIGIAASVLLLIGAFWVFMPNQNQKLNRQLATVALDPGLPTSLSATTNPDFAEGMNAFKREDYETARNLWQPLLIESPTNDTLLFYMAQIELEATNNGSAQEKFRQLLNQSGSIFFEKAHWYLAVALLREGKIEEATKLLREVQQKEGVRSDEAEELLKYIK